VAVPTLTTPAPRALICGAHGTLALNGSVVRGSAASGGGDVRR
jgi:hypothetical protein